MAKRVGLVYDDRMCAHANSDDRFHPERPARITAIFRCLEFAGIVERCVRVEAREATPAELASVHMEAHVLLMCAISSKKYSRETRLERARDYNSIYFNEGSSKSALLAAGSVVEVSLRVARGDLRAGAAVVRPPGHHAEPGEAMGFCLFNNVAVAAHRLVHGSTTLGVHRVLIVDWDVHHGNGTQHVFWSDPQVLYFSIHRHDDGMFYPGGHDGDYDKIGAGDGIGFNINVPWPHGGFGDLDYMAVFDNILMPIAREFKPDMVLVSGGFDSARGDPLGGCEVTPAGYSQIMHRLMGLADGRVVLALEGGYNLKSISDSYLACMKVLLGEKPEKITGTSVLMSSTMPLVKKIRLELRPHWLVLAQAGDDIQAVQPYQVEVEDNSKGNSIQGLPGSVSAIQVSEPEFMGSVVPVHIYSLRGEVSDLNLLVKDFNNALTLNLNPKEVSTGCEDGHISVEGHCSRDKISRRTAVDNHLAGDLDQEGKKKSNRGMSVKSVCSSSPSEVGSSSGEEPEVPEVQVETYAEEIGSFEGFKPCEEHGPCCRKSDKRLVQDNNNKDGCEPQGLCPMSSSVFVTGSAPAREQPDNTYVWYASYASNLWTARLMCYIKGGQAEGMAKGCVGARDQEAPVDSRWLLVPHTLFFGHSWTDTWGSGGVAFLDPVSHEGPPTTHLRLYKITLQQLGDILTQENGEDPRSLQFSFEWNHIDLLRNMPASASESHSTFDFLKGAWYGTIKYLGEEDGLPILTITCSLSDMQKFREGKLLVYPPSESYRKVIIRGLLENERLSEEEAESYIVSTSRELLR